MDGADIGLSILIVLIFGSLLLFNVLAIGVKNIKDNWPLYRCNPVIMPFATIFGHETGPNFIYCIQNMNLNFMPYLLDPINYFINNLTAEGEKIGENITGILGLGTGIEKAIMYFINDGFSIILNLYVVFQEILIKLRDTLNKMIGIITTLLFTLGGLQLTVESIWNGPVGGFTRTVAGIAGGLT